MKKRAYWAAAMLAMFPILLLSVFMPTAKAYSAYGWQWPVTSHRLMTQSYHSGHKALDIHGEYKVSNIYPTKPGIVIKTYTGCKTRSAASTKNNHTCAGSDCTPSTGNRKKYTKGTKTYRACNYGIGNGVVIDHQDGTYSSYSHMWDVNVKEGQSVNLSTCLGTVGATGNAAGIHLHFVVGTSVEGNVQKKSSYVHVTNPINTNPASEASKIKSKNWTGVVKRNGYAVDNGNNSGGSGLNYTHASYLEPGKPRLEVTGGTSLTNTIFEWNNTTDTMYFTLRVYKADGNLYNTYGGIISNEFSIVLPAGNYSATVTAVNTTYSSWQDSDKKTFQVKSATSSTNPGKPTLNVTPSAETYFSWNSTSNTEYYTLRIFDSSGELYRMRGSWKKTYFYALLPSGNYSATVAAVNNTAQTWTYSNKVSFTVPAKSTPEPGEYVAGMEVNHKLFNVYKKNNINWTDAKAIAAASNGRFAMIRDQDEQDVVESLVAQYGLPCWLGAETFADQAWKWVNGSSLSYTNWADNQPDMGYGLQNCLEIIPSGEWYDETSSCWSSSGQRMDVYGYVLEFDPLWISAFLNVDNKPVGTPVQKSDVLVFVCFADQSLAATSDYGVSVSGTTKGKQTITVTYGNLKTTVDVQYVDSRKMSAADFVIPKKTTVIGPEAFQGNAMRVVRCPEGITKIDLDAFVDCKNLKEIYIPASVTEIENDIFARCPKDLTIFGQLGSAAHEFANAYYYTFMPVSQ